MKKLIMFLIFIVILLLLSIILYDKFVLNIIDNKYFSINYDYTWDKIDGSDNTLILKRNDSYIEIASFTSDSKETDVYMDLYKKYLDDNPDYYLLSRDKTYVGKNYYEGYEYLFENNLCKSLLFVIVKDNKVIEVNYTSYSNTFYIDLNSFYNILNSIKI